MTKKVALIFSLLVFAASAQAAVIYDESTDGDLDANFPGTPIGVLPGGVSTVLGSLDGGALGGPPGPDESDVFQFTASSGFTLAMDELAGVRPIAFFYEVVGGTTLSFIDAGANSQATLFGPEFGAGTYALNIVPIQNAGQSSYGINITTVGAVSAPAVLPLMIAGMGIVAARRRRQSASPTL